MNEDHPPEKRLLNRNFLLLWQGQVVTLMGGQAYTIAMVLWLKQTTGSAALMGAITMLGGLACFLSMLGGAVADRCSRVKMIVWLDLISGGTIVGLATAFFLLPDQTTVLIALLFLANILREICRALLLPATTALVPDVVPKEKLAPANSCMHSSLLLSQILGQGIGGVLFRVLGAPLMFLVDGVSFLLSAVSECFIRPAPHAQPEPEHQKTGYLTATKEGLRFAWRHEALRTYFTMAATCNFLFSAYWLLMPFYVTDVLGAGPDWFGYLLAASGCGALAGSIAASTNRGSAKQRGTLAILGLIGYNVFMVSLTLTQANPVALGLSFMSGLSIGYYAINLTSILQNKAPSHMRGRLMGLQNTLRNGLSPLGFAFFGVVADLTGKNIIGIWAVCGCLALIAIIWGLCHRDLRAFYCSRVEKV